MRIALTERFQRDVRGLAEEQRARAFEAILALPSVMGNPHAHAGLGFRKIHHSGIWEVRLGLGLRVVFRAREGTVLLEMMGDHDEVRRYLKSL